jgi:hypothetical protein
MLVRVSCKACHLSSIWTDDPEAFLHSVCLRYRHCEAKLADEAFVAKPVLPAALMRVRQKSTEPKRRQAAKSPERRPAGSVSA